MDPQDSIQWAIQYPQIIQNLQMLFQGLVKGLSDLDFIELIKL